MLGDDDSLLRTRCGRLAMSMTMAGRHDEALRMSDSAIAAARRQAIEGAVSALKGGFIMDDPTRWVRGAGDDRVGTPGR